ncbi:serine/threonine-protein kinase 17B isoform X3 [Ornithorhynchus anatinus]|uniref:Serine/threonine-protein kinase 17B n=1 Tax=Ornithorhynchus anatinus TaxID=9258 RepID=A0A6I8NIY8_ORNAN|nr:serine/threonine-protein kinase 17B isoform X3 [Ornithorhynchus anatinus]XP_028925133.1 serine/threonine-protein kinase 17B isoform X3 [Ornithorhynchus anatinus]
MSRRRADSRSLLPPTAAQTPIRVDNFHNFYTLTSRELGRGKFAVVRQCVSKSTSREYAAKFLKKRRRGRDCRAEIVHEIAVLDLTRASPRVVTLHEAYETDREIILVLEYAAGGEIFNLCLPEVAVPEHDVVRLVRQILEGLCHLHQNGIVHLDLKPQNILLSALQPLGDVKLVDFGLSRKLSGPCELREILGTPEYLAPEVLNYDPITTATDMWNIGIIAYMLLAHSSPFAGEDNQETYLNISQVNVDYSEPAFSSVSHLARDFIRTLLVKNPEERPTASSCLSHPWLQQRASAPSPHPADASSSSPSSSSSTPQAQDLPAKCPEDRPVKPPSASPCGPREDKENIPEGRSTKVPKRFRFDAALRPPPELVPDLVF